MAVRSGPRIATLGWTAGDDTVPALALLGWGWAEAVSGIPKFEDAAPQVGYQAGPGVEYDDAAPRISYRPV